MGAAGPERARGGEASRQQCWSCSHEISILTCAWLVGPARLPGWSGPKQGFRTSATTRRAKRRGGSHCQGVAQGSPRPTPPGAHPPLEQRSAVRGWKHAGRDSAVLGGRPGLAGGLVGVFPLPLDKVANLSRRHATTHHLPHAPPLLKTAPPAHSTLFIPPQACCGCRPRSPQSVQQATRLCSV